jgi:hypothetical protein
MFKLNERTINIPDKILVKAGKVNIEVSTLDMSGVDYLKLCISLGFWSEEGVIS